MRRRSAARGCRVGASGSSGCSARRRGSASFLARHPEQLGRVVASRSSARRRPRSTASCCDRGRRSGEDRGRGRLDRPPASRTGASWRGSPRGTSRSRTRSTSSHRSRRPSPTSRARPSTRRSQLARRASRFPADEVAATRLAIIGMGKAGRARAQLRERRRRRSSSPRDRARSPTTVPSRSRRGSPC